MSQLSSIASVRDGRICIWSPQGKDRGVTVMIDNYDSFTFNVAQFLVEAGANVVIFRNDMVTLETIEALRPEHIVISPGPGHPETDAGVSIPCIKHFSGRVPILGICMGLQSITVAFGGVVDGAGEIYHGKTSDMYHDGRGLFAGLPASEPITATRYHSLCANIESLPDVLVQTSHVDSGIIMGIRHKKFTIESVQYHPESVMSEHGHDMMRNFLSWRGGTWEENPHAQVYAVTLPSESILSRIYHQRRIDVEQAQAIPGRSLADLEKSLALHLDPAQIDFPRRLLQGTEPSVPGVMAEIKRASPSKGNIALHAHAGEQALAYAQSGANVISVLTEPTWFKGTIEDLALVRHAVERIPNRPAILRKDFIVHEYQIAEARLAGADTILLIVAMLDDITLHRLYAYSKHLGMEPLVEVNCAEEMQRALQLEPQVIGINNRNLHSFEVDMSTTTRLAQAALEHSITLVALSGIQGRVDVEQYLNQGVRAILVGEAFMRAQDKMAFMAALRGQSVKRSTSQHRFVKVCGIKTPEAAVAAAQSGADLLGIILAPDTKRTVSDADALEIVNAVHRIKRSNARASAQKPTEWFAWHAQRMAEAVRQRPLVVGVFRNQSLEEIAEKAMALGLDAVQLHGRVEELDWAKFLPGVFVIRVFHMTPDEEKNASTLHDALRPGYHHIILLDTANQGGQDGGSGASFNWSHVSNIPVPFLIAGGLTPDNVQEALTQSLAAGVDTSSGVETEGQKDTAKITAYVENARRVLS